MDDSNNLFIVNSRSMAGARIRSRMRQNSAFQRVLRSEKRLVPMENDSAEQIRDLKLEVARLRANMNKSNEEMVEIKKSFSMDKRALSTVAEEFLKTLVVDPSGIITSGDMNAEFIEYASSVGVVVKVRQIKSSLASVGLLQHKSNGRCIYRGYKFDYPDNLTVGTTDELGSE